MLSVSLLLRVLGGNTALVEALRNPARPYVEETYDCLEWELPSLSNTSDTFPPPRLTLLLDRHQGRHTEKEKQETSDGRLAQVRQRLFGEQ